MYNMATTRLCRAFHPRITQPELDSLEPKIASVEHEFKQLTGYSPDKSKKEEALETLGRYYSDLTTRKNEIKEKQVGS